MTLEMRIKQAALSTAVGLVLQDAAQAPERCARYLIDLAAGGRRNAAATALYRQLVPLCQAGQVGAICQLLLSFCL